MEVYPINQRQIMYDELFFRNMAKAYFNKTAWTQLRLMQVQKFVNPMPGDKIIDLGCGMGSISHFCSLSGAEVTGVDQSPLAIEFAEKLFPSSKLRFLERDVADLRGFVDSSFDKAVSADLVEHITQSTFECMLSETSRVLKPGGTFFIYTPNPSHLFEIFKSHDFILKQNPTHIDLKTEQRLVSTIIRSGFLVRKVCFTPSFIPLFDQLERIIMRMPLIGDYFKYRICVSCEKPRIKT
jgi:2-polyprenyl-3-methyl-5-hydroxy-6-metoxy-1,4-benzoquinol methylase